ncbi:MAG: hypothetical protein EHM27_01435 [Deltaproteobacteria bacterium]|nr:MAG: hypothetical protein EHM27_10590 [Deltaproteobacteria bacterium]RPJ43135.1 MAG: hypothetical protein EHM27_01435 [Deltaproteobacteria bacterium]
MEDRRLLRLARNDSFGGLALSDRTAVRWENAGAALGQREECLCEIRVGHAGEEKILNPNEILKNGEVIRFLLMQAGGGEKYRVSVSVKVGESERKSYPPLAFPFYVGGFSHHISFPFLPYCAILISFIICKNHDA